MALRLVRERRPGAAGQPISGGQEPAEAFRHCAYSGGHMARTRAFMKPSNLGARDEPVTLMSCGLLRDPGVTALAGL